MKVLYVLVFLSILLSAVSIILALGVVNSDIIKQNPTVISEKKDIITVSYKESSKKTVDNDTILILYAKAALTSGNSVTVNFSQFVLNVFVSNEESSIPSIGTRYSAVSPRETGCVTVDKSDVSRTFSLTFVFPSEGRNLDGDISQFSSYQLDYCGNVTIQLLKQ